MRKLLDNLAVAGIWIVVCLILALIVLGPVAAHIFAPCEWIDWMPVKQMPGRCLPGGRG